MGIIFNNFTSEEGITHHGVSRHLTRMEGLMEISSPCCTGCEHPSTLSFRPPYMATSLRSFFMPLLPPAWSLGFHQNKKYNSGGINAFNPEVIKLKIVVSHRKNRRNLHEVLFHISIIEKIS